MFSVTGAFQKSIPHSENQSETGILQNFVGIKFLAIIILCLFTIPSFSQISTRLVREESFSINDFSFSTTAYTPKAGTMLLAVVTNTNGNLSSANSEAAPSGVSGNGLTWTLVKSILYSNNNRRISVYRAVTGAAPTLSGFSVNFPGSGNNEKRRSCIIQIIEVEGVELTGSNGSDAISSIVDGTGHSKTASISVNDITSAGTGMLGLFGGDDHNENFTEETGWTMLSKKGVDNGNPIAAGIVGVNNTYDKEAKVLFGDNTRWGAIALQLVPANHMFGFPCSGTPTTATNFQPFWYWIPISKCIQGNASNLNLILGHAAASFVVKSGHPSFSSVSISNQSTLVIDQGAAATFTSGFTISSKGNLFVANGASGIVNGDVELNSGNIRVYGNLTINGNLTVNNNAAFYVGSIGNLTVTGTLTINTGSGLIAGGNTKVNKLVTNGGASIELAEGATLDATVFNENYKPNVLMAGPGGGCLGMVGPNGAIANIDNGFRPITASSDIKICLPSNGVIIGAYFNANKGSAQVSYNCSGCAFILGSNILPVSLLSFDGILSSTGTSQLSWKVANNDEVARFAVEYSTNGTTFEKVGSLKKGNTSTYRFEHSSTHKGLIYYRLLMYDKEGNATYSRIVTLLHSNESSTRILNVMPTVTSSTTQVSLFSATQQQLTISIYDAAGRALKTEKKQVNKGLQNITLNLTGLPQGYLFVNTFTQDGQHKTVKVLKM